MRSSHLGVLLFCLAAASGLWAAEAAPELLSKMAPVPPCQSLVAAAQANKIALEGIDSATDTNVLNPGDSFAALVTLCEKGARRTQWLLHLQAEGPATNEPSRKVPAPMVLYSSCGNKFEFASSPVFVRLRTLGPFAEPSAKRKPPKVKDLSARFALDQGFLSLGLDRGSAAILRMKQTGTKGDVWFRSKPFGEAEVSKARKLAAAVRLTAQEERAMGASVPALLSYFKVVQETQGLENILLQVVDLPSFWSILWQRGVTANLRFEMERLCSADSGLWRVPARPPAFYFPLELDLNKHHALDVTMVVTDPRPPLLACGGVIALLAEKPGDKETYLTLRIISARRSGAGS
jgi:hypothetical protein